jgi:maltoporin
VSLTPLAGEPASQSATKAETDASAKQAAVAIVSAVSGTEAKDASSEKAERNEKGIEAGKTPLYENVNDEQNLAIQQAKAFEFHGYLRSGAGVNSRGGQQVYFEAPGAPLSIALGTKLTHMENLFL